MNSRVVLRNVDTGQQHVFTVVFPSCANTRRGRISVLTPLGSMLLGARTGQTLTCPISGVIANVVVDAILHQPEAAGDYYG
jgi:regulator of nucleoside diphosphate kinase